MTNTYFLDALRKRATDARAFTVDVADAMRDGDKVGAVSSVVIVESASGVTIDSLGYEGTKIEFRASGGTAGADLHVRITWQTAAAPVQTLSTDVELEIV